MKDDFRVLCLHETTISAKKAQARQDTRVPLPHCECDRPARPQTPTPKRPEKALSVMSKKDRLTSSDFRSLKPERRLHGALFSLTLSTLPAGKGAQFACVVSKKVSLKATERNLIKRRCRAAIVMHKKGITGKALVFTAKRESLKATYQEIEKDISSLFMRTA